MEVKMINQKFLYRKQLMNKLQKIKKRYKNRILKFFQVQVMIVLKFKRKKKNKKKSKKRII